MGTLDLAEKYSSPIQYGMEHDNRDVDLEYIYMCRELSRWYLEIWEDGTENAEFVHNRKVTIEDYAIERTRCKNTDIGWCGWHTIVAIKWQDGTITKMDLTETKRLIQEDLEDAKKNIEFAKEQLKGLDWDCDRDRRMISSWKNEIDLNTTPFERDTEILKKIQEYEKLHA